MSIGQGVEENRDKNALKHQSPGAGCGFTCTTGTWGCCSRKRREFGGGKAASKGLEAGRD